MLDINISNTGIILRPYMILMYNMKIFLDGWMDGWKYTQMYKTYVKFSSVGGEQ